MDSILTVLLLVLVLVGAMIGIGHLLWVGIATLLGYQVRTVSRSQSKSQQQHSQGQSVEETLNDLAVAGLIDKPTLFRVLEALKIHRARSLTPVELIATQKAAPPPLPAIPVEPIAALLKLRQYLILSSKRPCRSRRSVCHRLHRGSTPPSRKRLDRSRLFNDRCR